MKTTDKILLSLIGICLPVILFMSASNVYSVLIGTGNPAFIEHPWTAISLSALAPIASLTPKLIMRAFRFKRTKKRYAMLVYTMTCLVFMAWCVLYGMHYSAPSGELDIDLDATEDITGNLLLFTQLLTEILVGTSLFIGMEMVLEAYQEERYRANPRWHQHKKQLDQAQKHLRALQSRLADCQTKRAKLNAKRQRMIKKATMDFIRAQLHQDALKDL